MTFRKIYYSGLLPFRMRIAHSFFPMMRRIFVYERAISLRATIALGYRVNLKQPRTFNEKILYRKLFKSDDRLPVITDKVCVRDYVSGAGYNDILNEIYGVFMDSRDIDIDKLPDKYVIKANYGSGLNIFVSDKNKMSRDEIHAKCTYWMKSQEQILANATEVHYRAITPRLLVERFLSNPEGDELNDYKIYCFHGVPHFINVHTKRRGLPISLIFDTTWQPASFSIYNRPIRIAIHPPSALDRMLEIASHLASGFDFLRVDLYALNSGEVIFGELSYNPAGGIACFFPRIYDHRIGDLM